ncbi:hypothetical protein HYC85_021404 [Camellia sinensis]|uniref:Uncharacterized protein n=1 Tax=Camellia sinensis TaxID=4442 RepID=A0A7J7GIF4_CAMSI|nr:hypothetical protein HYC85_021404 [Camellia sinensis]
MDPLCMHLTAVEKDDVQDVDTNATTETNTVVKSTRPQGSGKKAGCCMHFRNLHIDNEYSAWRIYSCPKLNNPVSGCSTSALSDSKSIVLDEDVGKKNKKSSGRMTFEGFDMTVRNASRGTDSSVGEMKSQEIGEDRLQLLRDVSGAFKPASENAFKGILTSLPKAGGGEFGKFYSLPALNDPRIESCSPVDSEEFEPEALVDSGVAHHQDNSEMKTGLEEAHKGWFNSGMDSLDVQDIIKRHQSQIITSLKDPDISIRRRALDLVYGMCDVSNAKDIVEELLQVPYCCSQTANCL